MNAGGNKAINRLNIEKPEMKQEQQNIAKGKKEDPKCYFLHGFKGLKRKNAEIFRFAVRYPGWMVKKKNRLILEDCHTAVTKTCLLCSITTKTIHNDARTNNNRR